MGEGNIAVKHLVPGFQIATIHEHVGIVAHNAHDLGPARRELTLIAFPIE
jgi:hypothetical protein